MTANPKTTTGAIVIWGGRIMNVVNTTNRGEIYVLQLPLSGRGRPANDNSASEGRFIAVSPEFLDPAKYPGGSLITVAGQLDGVRSQRLQNVFYRYPLLDIKQIQLWTNRPKNYNYYYYGENPNWYWGYYYPVWWNGGVGWYYPGGYEASQGGQTRSGGGHR